MAATYEPIATNTLSSSTNSVTFSSITSSYTDIVAVVSGKVVSSGVDLWFRLNGDTGANYSWTYLTGDTTDTASGRVTGTTYSKVTLYSYLVSTGALTTSRLHFQNYSNSTTYKTILSQSGRGAVGGANGGADNHVNLWRSTAAITSITFMAQTAGSFEIGTTFTLYGIKAA